MISIIPILSEVYERIWPVALFSIGILLYALFTFHFYFFLSRKEFFEFNLENDILSMHPFWAKTYHVSMYLLKYLIIFPLFTFLWFTFLALVLIFISNQSIEEILMISISLVAAIRGAAYYSEDLSKDLAKMVPFALLGIFFVNIHFFSLTDSLTKITLLPSFWKTFIYYLVFVMLFELLLKGIQKFKE